MTTSAGILTSNKSPMTRGEIAVEIERRGTVLPGNDRSEKAKYVGTILWRNSEIFQNLEGKGYWLAGEPFPKSGDADIFHELENSNQVAKKNGPSRGKLRPSSWRNYAGGGPA